MTSLVLLAVGLVGCAGAFVYAAQQTRLAQDTLIAEKLASALLSEARSRDHETLMSWYTYPGESGLSGLEADFNQQLTNSGLPFAEAWLSVAEVQEGLKGLNVVITWRSAGLGGRVEADTLIGDRF